MDWGPCIVHGKFIQVTILTLDQEKEHAVLCTSWLEGWVASHKKSSLFNLFISNWDWAFSIIMIYFLIDKEPLTDNYNTAWSIWLTWDLNKHMSCFVDWSWIFTDNMIKSKIHFIENKHFLVLSCHNWTILVIWFTIVDLKTCELRIFNANINTNHCKCDCMSFMCL